MLQGTASAPEIDGRGSTRPPPGDVDRERFPYRMKDLCELTGLERQAIHFYIQQGLVAEGHKTGRNMAYYGPEHVERIQLVRRLQHERFLPLKAIRALLDGAVDAFSPAQRALIVEVKHALSQGKSAERALSPAAPLLAEYGVPLADLERMAELGLIALVERDGVAHIADDDAWLVATWAGLRSAGLDASRGFSVDDLAIFEEAVGKLFERETELVTTRLATLPPAEVAQIVERSLPLVATLLTRLHENKIRDFFAALG